MNEKNKTDYFQGLIQQILTLSTGGIAAGVAFMQINGVDHQVIVFIFIAIVLFVISLACGIWGLMAIIGIASDAKPDFNQTGVRGPNLVSVMGFFLGIFSFLVAAYLHYSSKPVQKIATQEITRQMEISTVTPIVEVVGKLNKEQQLLLGYFIDRAFKANTGSTPQPVNTKPAPKENH